MDLLVLDSKIAQYQPTREVILSGPPTLIRLSVKSVILRDLPDRGLSICDVLVVYFVLEPACC